MEGIPKILDFGYIVLMWWQTEKKTQQKTNPEPELQKPVYLDKTANCVINYRIR